MAQDVNVRNWKDIERVLYDTFTQALSNSKKEDRDSSGFQQNFTSILTEHKAALVENTENIQNLTNAIQNLSGGIGGGGRPTNSVNAPTPGEGQTGAAATPTLKRKVLSGLGFTKDDSIFAGMENNPIFDNLARSFLLTGKAGIGGALGAVSQFLPQNVARNFYAETQSRVEPYVTQPTELGMAAGYQGPGYESFSNAGSSFGSLVAGRFGLVSNILTGGANPNLVGGFLGSSMSEAQSQGLRTQYRAFARSLNPFDMLSYERATEINQAVASKGFRSLGQQVSVEEALTDIVQKTGIDAGAALDTLDLSIKRLGTDVKDASNLLKEYGPLAKAAGKSVTEFAQESNQVLNQISSVGATGSGAQIASLGYSGFSQLEGGAVSQFLNSPELSGLMAASMMGGGPGSQFGNPADMLSLAMGYAPAMGGGGNADEVFIAQVENMQKLVTTVQKQSGVDRKMAQMMVANMTGQPPLLIQQIDNEGKKVIEGMKVTGKLSEFTEGYRKYRQGPQLRGTLATTSDEGKAAFGQLKEMHGTGSVGDTGRMGGGKFFQGGIDFGRVDIGGKDPDFEEKVQKLYEAKASGNQGAVDALLRQFDQEGVDVDEVDRAAGLLLQAGRGNQGAWKSLNQEFGVRVRGQNGEWVSDQGKIPKEARQKAISEMRDFTKDFFERGVISEKQKASLLKKINSRESITPEKFQSEVQRMVTRKRQQDNEIKISLSGDAKKWFNVFNKNAGSAQGKLVTVAPPGTDNRATPFPWLSGG